MDVHTSIPAGQQYARVRWNTQESGAAFDRKKKTYLTEEAQQFNLDDFYNFEAGGWVSAGGQHSNVFGLVPWLTARGYSEFVTHWIVPSVFWVAGILIMVGLVKRIFRPTRRELIIALFTGFFVTYWVLTIVGTSFRGRGQNLIWPWHLPLTH